MSRTYAQWTREEDELLRRECRTHTTAELAAMLNRTGKATAKRLSRLGLKALNAGGGAGLVWTVEEDAVLRKLYGTVGAAEIGRRLGRSEAAVRARAKTLEIVKGPSRSGGPSRRMQGKPTRRCHDCGRPTSDYRCQKCWEKLRKKRGCEGKQEEETEWKTL